MNKASKYQGTESTDQQAYIDSISTPNRHLINGGSGSQTARAMVGKPIQNTYKNSYNKGDNSGNFSHDMSGMTLNTTAFSHNGAGMDLANHLARRNKNNMSQSISHSNIMNSPSSILNSTLNL